MPRDKSWTGGDYSNHFRQLLVSSCQIRHDSEEDWWKLKELSTCKSNMMWNLMPRCNNNASKSSSNVGLQKKYPLGKISRYHCKKQKFSDDEPRNNSKQRTISAVTSSGRNYSIIIVYRYSFFRKTSCSDFWEMNWSVIDGSLPHRRDVATSPRNKLVAQKKLWQKFCD